MRIPDAVADHYARLLDDSGIFPLIDTELGVRPGPAGLPIRAALTCLLLLIHYTGKAVLGDAWQIAAFSLSPAARRHLGMDPADIDADDPHACLAASRRFYRAFDRLTTILDPARHDRRARLPKHQADHLATAWEDDDVGHARKRQVLQQIVTALVLTPVRRAKGRGYLRGFAGDIGIDTTAAPTLARPPCLNKGLASTEITAGWHYSAGEGPPQFGHSATLTVAARPRALTAAFPQLALGLVVDTPHKRIGANAITTLTSLAGLGLPSRFAAVDRAYTDQAADHFARPARALGYQLVLDYKQDQRGIQGSAHGALLIDGTLACPLIPDRLAQATTGLNDAAARSLDDELSALIAARQPYFLHHKQGPNAQQAIRLQCPAAGTSPSITCPRFERLHHRQGGRPAPIDLADARRRAAHPSAKPRTLPPLRDQRPEDQPKVCRQQSITLHPGDLGHLDKFRQDLPYLTPAWAGTYRAVRANTEGINGRLKSFDLDLGEPKNRPAHGRVAQTLLIALIVTVANDNFLDAWRHTHQPEPAPSDITTELGGQEVADPPIPAGKPPPGP
ncbi:hypothetical protein DP939_43385 [Spongiactinospora rosea]|uniref:Transposase n=1 Tax=Spongiactinospora rosea TaxID=2248750 RepID=A0A366LJ65_9ACTN|nr:hypothetical protein [Spongiactinospora rosea]RBQ13935.1 hypothetical protein DP939_43385 [Spongiactinospora rosea]